MATHEVAGGRELRRSLRQAGDDLSDLKKAHRDAATVARDRIAQRAPEGDTGRLKATIRAAGTKTAGIVRVGNNTRVKYAGVQQWGWGRRNIPATLFATRGAKESEPRWLPIYQFYIDTTLNRIQGI